MKNQIFKFKIIYTLGNRTVLIYKKFGGNKNEGFFYHFHFINGHLWKWFLHIICIFLCIWNNFLYSVKYGAHCTFSYLRLHSASFVTGFFNIHEGTTCLVFTNHLELNLFLKKKHPSLIEIKLIVHCGTLRRQHSWFIHGTKSSRVRHSITHFLPWFYQCHHCSWLRK